MIFLCVFHLEQANQLISQLACTGTVDPLPWKKMCTADPESIAAFYFFNVHGMGAILCSCPHDTAFIELVQLPPYRSPKTLQISRFILRTLSSSSFIFFLS
jgi:hypothetical protein